MVPILSIVGSSDSGKTTFIESLIPELNRLGYRVGTVKHDVHGFEMDREGKDTWKHARAGAASIAISSPNQAALIRKTGGEMELDELAARFFWDMDLVLTEGYKRERFPKIEVFRKAVAEAPICGDKDNLIAMVTDDAVETPIPIFGFSEAARMAEFIAARYLRERKRHAILVQIDGKRLPMKDFVGDFVLGGIRGMLSELRGWKEGEVKTISIQILLGKDT